MVIRYHKGIKNTLVPLGSNKYEINDIVVRQDGQIFADWDFTNKNLLPTMLLHDNTKEIMQRSRERMVEIASTPYTTCGGGAIGGCGGAYSSFHGYSCGGGSSCG
jgi:hypothetical protein